MVCKDKVFNFQGIQQFAWTLQNHTENQCRQIFCGTLNQRLIQYQVQLLPSADFARSMHMQTNYLYTHSLFIDYVITLQGQSGTSSSLPLSTTLVFGLSLQNRLSSPAHSIPHDRSAAQVTPTSTPHGQHALQCYTVASTTLPLDQGSTSRLR